jgi:hypothetical protein
LFSDTSAVKLSNRPAVLSARAISVSGPADPRAISSSSGPVGLPSNATAPRSLIDGLPKIEVKPSPSSAIVASGPPDARRILSSKLNVSGLNSDAENATAPKLLIAGH